MLTKIKNNHGITTKLGGGEDPGIVDEDVSASKGVVYPGEGGEDILRASQVRDQRVELACGPFSCKLL